MKNKKIKRMIMVGVLGLALFACCYGYQYKQYQDAIATMNYTAISFDEVDDGLYEGECDVGFIQAKLQVVIENGVLVDISLLEHKNERGKTAEIIIEHMVEKQSLEVDVISGATNSSMVIRKAIENALCKGLVQ